MKFFSLILLIICFGCATKTINYDRNKIIKKHQNDYTFFLNDNEIIFENVYLKKNNITKIEVYKKKKTIVIHQKNKSNLFKLKEQNLDQFIDDSFVLDDLDCQNCFLVIEGRLLPISKINNIYFEENIINDIIHLKEVSFDKTLLIVILN